MKKKVWVIISAIIVCILALSGCANSKQYEAEIESLSAEKESFANEVTILKNEISDKESTIEAKTNEIDKLTQENESMKAELSTYNESVAAAEKEKTVQEGDVEVRLTDKGQINRDSSKWIFSDYVTLVFEVKNNTDKDIQGVQGYMIFKDLFGEEIISVNSDFTGNTIPAHSSIVVDDLTFECNQFMSDHMKLFNTDFKDLKTEYVVTKIVFTDGTTKDLA